MKLPFDTGLHTHVFNCRGRILFLMILSVLTACSSNKRISYFRDIPDSVFTAARTIKTSSFTEPVIQTNDILQVSIVTLDPQINNVLTSANTASYTVQPSNIGTAATTPALTGYMVDKNGMIELPLIGKLKVSGLNSGRVKEIIYEKVSLLYNKPVVNVRFANFSVTVLGEVARPATYIVPNEKISIMDAIGMAGDLTIYGKRENVLLVRDSMGQKQSVRFNLNSSNIFSSPYFYLHQGDMIYVEPTKSKVAGTDASKNRNITLIASGLSLLVVLFSRISL